MRCGFGSTLISTENLRKNLPAILHLCEIHTLIDAPCGDGNWISQTDLRGIRYWGFDISVENLQTAIGQEYPQYFKPERCAFERADIRTMVFPVADAIMCRDFFQHLPNASVSAIVNKIKNSNLKWLLATSFDNETNTEIGADGFRPLNLQAPPFNLGQPEYSIPDPPNSGRILGAWRL